MRRTLFLVLIFVIALPAVAADRAAWMQGRWGVMTHYLADTVVKGTGTTVEEWNKLIDSFDVEGLARQLESARANYYLITLGQNSGFYISPNSAYDRLTGIKPSKCSRRDLIPDLYKALNARGIKLMVYLPAGAPDRDVASMKALEWQRGPYPNIEFQDKWEQVIREWSQRWGTRIVGWWFDGCYWPNIMYRRPNPPNFASFAAAARAGNPNNVVTFNRGVIYPILSMTEQEDYTAGEINEPARVQCSGKVDAPFRCANTDGVQFQMLSYLGESWGHGSPRFSNSDAVGTTVRLTSGGAAVTWDVPIKPSGLLAEQFLDQLKAIGSGVAAKTK